MESNPESSLLSPMDTENSIPPPSKRQKILSDKDGELCDDNRHSAECSSQIVLYKDVRTDDGKDEQGENHLSHVSSKPPKRKSLSIGAYAVQCAKCGKWRLVPTKEKYEQLRERIQEDPFTCEKACEWKPDVTCDVPSDISPNDSQLWAMDKPNIAQPPPGWERSIKIRSERSTRFADVYYCSPAGKILRSITEVEKYLEEHPEYAARGVKLSQFSFTIPAPPRPDYVKKRNQTSRNARSTKPLPEEVLPIAWSAPPTHGDPGDSDQLVPHNEDPPQLLLLEPPETEPGNQLPPSAV